MKADFVVPLGGSMRAAFLQAILKKEMQKDVLSMTANMDEEIATGDARISYLLAENKGLAFDERLKNECVFACKAYDNAIFAKEPKTEGVFVTCNETYLACVERHRYAGLSDESKAATREGCVRG